MADNVVIPMPQLRDGLWRPVQIHILTIAALAALVMFLAKAGAKGFSTLVHHKIRRGSMLAPSNFSLSGAQLAPFADREIATGETPFVSRATSTD